MKRKQQGYQPNFKRKDVRHKVSQAVATVETWFRSDTEVRSLANTLIYHESCFGQAQTPIAKFLKSRLLITVNNTYRFGSDFNRCKTYRINPQGVAYVKHLLAGGEGGYADFAATAVSNTAQAHADRMFERYADEIRSGEFQMKPAANRLFHPLITVKTDLRQRKFAEQGYHYDYDIQSAAPTLLLQRARMQGFDTATPQMDYYLANKELVRQQIASTAGIQYQQAKMVLLALLQGGHLSSHRACITFTQTLAGDYQALETLRGIQFIQELQAELRQLWSHICRDEPRTTYTDRNGIVRRRRISGSVKTRIYREEEERVMKAVRNYFRKSEPLVRVMWEHDGWRTDSLIDVNELKSSVRRATGYMIEIDMETY